MVIDDFITIQNLMDGLFRWNLQYVFGRRQRIDNLDVPGALSEFANIILLVLPPRNQEMIHFLTLGSRQVQISALGTEILFFAGWRDELPWLFGLWIEPVGDVGARGLDHRACLFDVDVLLDQLREVVDFIEEGHPQIVWLVMLG